MWCTNATENCAPKQITICIQKHATKFMHQEPYPSYNSFDALTKCDSNYLHQNKIRQKTELHQYYKYTLK